MYLTLVLELVMQVRKYGVAWRTQSCEEDKPDIFPIRRILYKKETTLEDIVTYFHEEFSWCPSVHDHAFLWSEANISTTATEKTPGLFRCERIEI